jgi:ketosteroid isomerase-like protein
MKGGTVRIAGVLMVFLWSASLILSAQGDADSAVQSKIIALEKAWNQAYKHADRRALARLLDDQVVLINDDGTVQTKAEFLAGVTKSNAQQQQVAPESMSVHVFGNTAISVGVFQAKGIGRGNSYTRRERFVDTWVYKGGNWVCVATNATPILH